MGQLSSDELVKAVELLELVPQIGGITSSEYLKISQKKNHIEFALSSSISGVVRVKGQLFPEQLSYCVARKVFSPFVLVGKESKKDFESKFADGKLTLRQGNRTAEFVVRSDEIGGYGKWMAKDLAETISLSEEAKKLLTVSNRCATSDPTLPSLNCVYLKDGYVLASNQTVVFSAILKNGNSLNFPFPREVISILSHPLIGSAGIDGSRVILGSSFGHLEASISAKAKKSFPVQNVHAQIAGAKKMPVMAKLSGEVVKDMMGRMATYLSAMEDSKPHLNLDIENGKMRMTVKAGHGTFVERDSSDSYSTETHIGWPLDYVKPVFDYMGENAGKIIVRGDDKKKSPYLVSGADVDLLVARKNA
jgi:hypothetical protein